MQRQATLVKYHLYYTYTLTFDLSTGIYLTVSMAITSISIILTVWVLALHHCGPHQSAVPRWARRYVLGFLARIVGFKPLGGQGREKRSRLGRKIRRKKAEIPVGKTDNVDRFLDLVREISAENETVENSENSTRNNEKNKTKCATPPYQGGHIAMASLRRRDNGVSSCIQEDGSLSMFELTIKRLLIMEETLGYLKFLVAKSAADDRQSEITNEWRNVACVVDRCLFRVFLLVTAVSTFLMMVFVPVYMQ